VQSTDSPIRAIAYGLVAPDKSQARDGGQYSRRRRLWQYRAAKQSLENEPASKFAPLPLSLTDESEFGS
jgi:hypothetical protein